MAIMLSMESMIAMVPGSKKYDLSILMTTHDFSMLPRYCDRVVLLAGGKLIKKGTPLDVLNSDEFARAFHMGGGAE